MALIFETSLSKKGILLLEAGCRLHFRRRFNIFFMKNDNYNTFHYFQCYLKNSFNRLFCIFDVQIVLRLNVCITCLKSKYI